MANPTLAILEILEEISFKNALCIDVDEELKVALNLRSDRVLCAASDDLKSKPDLSNQVFDLIISFEDSSAVISKLALLGFSKNCEILIVSNNFISYAPLSSWKTLFKGRIRKLLIDEIKQNYTNFSIEAYYPFPNIKSPQMILSTIGLRELYFRYWSWLRPNGDMISKIFEVVMVGIFKSPRFSPCIILKLSKER